MVLQRLGTSITKAINNMNNATIFDEKVLNECLNKITRALLQADVDFRLVASMQSNIKKIVNLDDLAAGHNKRKIIQQDHPAVAATKGPVIFIGTGEHMDDFEVFDFKPFVSRLLGMGDWSGFMEKIQDVVPMDQQPELLQKLSEGSFTLRIMYDQFQNLLKMGPIGQVFSMLPRFSSELMPKGHEKESQAEIKRYMTMMDSMTDEELDSSNLKLINELRKARIARGSGRPIGDVIDLLEAYKKLMKQWKGLNLPALSRNMNMKHMSKAVSPHMLQNLTKQGCL